MQRRRPAQITSPMTPIGPVPLVGRQQELAVLQDHLSVVSLVSVHGPLGAGKSRLVGALAPGLGVPCTVIECVPGDRGIALRARAERALRCLPGTLAQALAQQARVLVIDDIHHLRGEEVPSLLAPLVLGPTALGRVVVVGRDPLSAALGVTMAELELGGLDLAAATALWAGLEEAFGPAAGLDAAFTRTRGLPLGLRREFARARFGAEAWTLSSLAPAALASLAALAILRLPVAPAGIAALAPGHDVEAALTDLVARQLVDAAGDGRLVLHEVVRADVIAHLAPEARMRLARAAAELVASTAAGATGPRLAWQAGDDGALGAMDQVTRMREVVWHYLVAGERDRAADALLVDRELAAHTGGAGEFESLLDAFVEGPRRRTGGYEPAGSVPEVIRSALDPERARALAALRVEIAVRGGRYTEAFERARAAPGAVSPLLHAELTLASGDAVSARRALTGLLGAEEPGERLRAVAMLAELELLAGAPDTAAAHLEGVSDLTTADPLARARFHLATARLDEYLGRVAQMRAALARAHGACKSVPVCLEAAELGAIVDARRAVGLAREGRLAEAGAALDAAAVAARDLDAVAVADEVASARALVARRRGDATTAAALLEDVVRARRERGDEARRCARGARPRGAGGPARPAPGGRRTRNCGAGLERAPRPRPPRCTRRRRDRRDRSARDATRAGAAAPRGVVRPARTRRRGGRVRGRSPRGRAGAERAARRRRRARAVRGGRGPRRPRSSACGGRGRARHGRCHRCARVRARHGGARRAGRPDDRARVRARDRRAPRARARRSRQRARCRQPRRA